MHRFLTAGRVDSVWEILRAYGYADDLSLKKEFLEPKIPITPSCTIELSDAGINFLTDLFRRVHDPGSDSLSPDKWDQLFSTAPQGLAPWTDQITSQTQTDPHTGDITLRGWLSLWSMTTLLNHTTTLQYMAYLGFEPSESGNNSEALKFVKLNNPHDRSTFMCYIFGSKGCGKTAILRGLINKEFTKELVGQIPPIGVVNEVDGQTNTRYLVIQEYGTDAEHLEDVNMEKADAIGLVYDVNNLHSFGYIAQIQKQLDIKFPDIPCIFIASKCDLVAVEQDTDVTPVAFCKSRGLDPPVKVSMAKSETNDIYNRIIRTILGGKKRSKSGRRRKRSKKKERTLSVGFLLIVGVITACALIAEKRLTQTFI